MSRIQEIELELLDAFLASQGLAEHSDWNPAGIDGLAFAARAGNRVVGAARVYRYWLHPLRWRLAVHVAPDARRQGIGTDLLGTIIDRLPAQDRRLQASVYSINTEGLTFLAHAGFEPLMTTRLGTFNPTSVPEQWREMGHRARHELEQQGIRIETLKSNPELFRAAALVHERIYRDQHGWNPPIELTTEECIKLFMNDEELEPTLQFIAIDNDRPCGVASLRTTEVSDLLDFGWFGTVDVPPDHTELLYRALWGMCIDAAANRRAMIGLEIDQADPYSNAIADELPVEWGDAWLTYCLRGIARHEWAGPS